jgi:hypothetical protein
LASTGDPAGRWDGETAMHISLRGRQATAAATAALLLLGSLGSASVFADGTCSGDKLEVVIPAEQQTVSPLAAYDRNGDGIVCSDAKGRFKKTQYSVNRI